MHPQRPLIIAQISELSKKLQDQSGYYLAQTKLRHYHSLRAEWVLARDLAEANVTIAEKCDNPDMISESYIVLARVYFYMGELLSAKAWYDRGQQIVETIDPNAPRFDAGQPPHVNAFTNIAHCYCLLGYLQQADTLRNRAIAIAETSQHPHALVEGLNFSLILDFMMQNTQAVQRNAEQMHAISQKYSLSHYVELSKLHQGWALLLTGCYDQAITQMQTAIEHFIATGLGMFHSLRLGMLIEGYRMAQRHREGMVAIQDALTFVTRTSDQFWLPELYRLQGELLLGSGAETHEVEKSYQTALAVARQQSSRLLELRTSVSLARLWQTQGKQTEAYQLLAPIYNWFTEGFGTPDLLAAQQLLAELQPAHGGVA
jgi:adenylate cyclase